MVTGVNFGSTRRYVLKSDQNRFKPTVFYIGALSAFMSLWIDDKMKDFVGNEGVGFGKAEWKRVAIRRRNILLLKYGIKDIANFIDPGTHAPVKVVLERSFVGFESCEVLPDRIISMIPAVFIGELADEVLRGLSLSEEEIKNLVWATRLMCSKNRPKCPKVSGSRCPEYEVCKKRKWKFSGSKEYLTGCLIEKITKKSGHYLEAFYFFDAKGLFPNPGGWQSQPAALLQAIQIIESERRKIAEEEDC